MKILNNYLPMLSHLGNKSYLSRKGFLFEPKLDGFRAILHKNNDEIKLTNKKGSLSIEQYPELRILSKSISPKSCVLDGEIIIYDSSGLPNFNLLQKRGSGPKFDVSENFATYVAFDILEIEGKPLTDKPLEDRKKILHDSVKENDFVELIAQTEKGLALWSEISKRKLEGVIAKKKESTYRPGERSWEWVKIKNLNTVDVVIIGYTSYKRQVSSLGMALYKNKKLTYVGKVGTGFNDEMLERLKSVFDRIKTQKAAAENVDEEMNWVRPEVVAEIQYLHLTHDEKLRAPSFKRLREDKPGLDCTFEDQIKS